MRKLFAIGVGLLVSRACFAGQETYSGKEMKPVAAPMPAPECLWTGFYVGAKLGWGWNTGDVFNFPLPDPVTFNQVPVDAHPDANGFIGGGELGYNWQIGRFVLGVETDFSGADVDGRDTVEPLFNLPGGPGDEIPGSLLVVSDRIDWFGTVRGRIGYTIMPCLLVYGTGGFAYIHRDLHGDVFIPPDETHPASVDDVATGWTAGGGLEYAINRHWSIKVEYLYLDGGSTSTSAVELGSGIPLPPFAERYTFDTQFHTVTAGINFKF